MEYTVNFKSADRDEDWSQDITNRLKVFAFEFKGVINMYYTLKEFLTEEEQVENNNMSDLEKDYESQNKSAFDVYKILYDNLLRRFGIFCELNNLHINITIKKNGQEFKQFRSNHIFEIKSIYSL